MKPHSKLIPFVLLLIAAVVVTVTAMLQVKKQIGPPSAALQKAQEDFYTIADYSSSEPIDPQKKASRKVRAHRYNLPASKGVDPKRFAITEERESSFGSPSSHAPIERALPAAQSNAVVVAEVVNAQAFLTEDKTEVVSEFQIDVREILKENLTAPFSVGDSLDILRLGGGVRFPSGKTIRMGIHGKPLPKIGGRYLFFLKYNADGGDDYVILTAYEFSNGHVVALDGIDLGGNVEPAYAEYQRYNNVDESTFRTAVIQAISQNLGAKREVERP